MVLSYPTQYVGNLITKGPLGGDVDHLDESLLSPPNRSYNPHENGGESQLVHAQYASLTAKVTHEHFTVH
jgi:hypothetical protein